MNTDYLENLQKLDNYGKRWRRTYARQAMKKKNGCTHDLKRRWIRCDLFGVLERPYTQHELMLKINETL